MKTYICKATFSPFNSLPKPNSNGKIDTFIVILGRMSRTRFIMMPTQGEGRPCPTELTQQKTCPVTPCYSWVLGNWSACKLEVGHVMTFREMLLNMARAFVWSNLCADGINFTAAGAWNNVFLCNGEHGKVQSWDLTLSRMILLGKSIAIH